MSDELKIKTVNALFWSFLERVGQQSIQFVISIILARLLLPEQFGLIAMLWIFMAIAQVFVDSGFSKALIQKQDVSYTDECSIFYFNILIGFIMAGILCAISPSIARFYSQPLLFPLTCTFSVNLVINAFSIVQVSLLTKKLDFKSQLIVSTAATVISGVIGIYMALNGYGVWSLVFQYISSNLSRTYLLWVLSSWRPSFIFSFASLKSMLPFGSRLTISFLIDIIFQNIYYVIIGRIFSSSDLGFYSRARHFQQLAVDNIANVVGRVIFPTLSSIQNDLPRLKRGTRKVMTMMVMVNFPLMIGMAIVAEPMILLLLTEKWAQSIVYLQLLCIVGFLYPLHVVNLIPLQVLGRSDLFLRIEILKKILIVVAVAITYRWGIVAMIYGQIATSCLSYWINSYFTGKLLNYSISCQIKDTIPSLALSCIMGVTIYCIKFFIAGNLLLLIVQVLAGILLYSALCYIFKLSSFLEAKEMVRSKILNRGFTV
ncbi:lipopolysaccharide biosynthesis protein [bacterium]|nr:lipopolysaccharide biosynthesis protein [bacterium]